MMLCHYITPLRTIYMDGSKGKNAILKELTEKLAADLKLKDPKDLLNLIMEREEKGSTFLPTGIAIPHARTTDVDEIQLMMGIIPGGVKESSDAIPTYIIFLILSPQREKTFGLHLKLLARISGIFRDPEFVQKLANEKDADKVFALLQHKERELIEE